MDPISNVDRIAALLQQKLRERSRSAATARGEKVDGRAGQAPGGLEAARALAALEGVNDRQRRRTFIQNILVDQFDPSLVNDAQFQQMVARVAQAIEDDEESAALLSRLLSDLGKG